MLKAMCNSQVSVHLVKLLMVWRTLFCRHCNFIRWASALNSQVWELCGRLI